MGRPVVARVEDLLALLPGGVPVPAADLLRQLGVSRPVLARLVATAGAQVLRIGKARATAYVATATGAAGSVWPLWRMNAQAQLEELGNVHALRGGRFQFISNAERPNLDRPLERLSGHFPDLPWFLDDLRPQGFLGRMLAHRHGRELGVPADLNSWRQHDIMLAITRTGGTGAGDLLLGKHAVDLALAELATPTDAVLPEQRSIRYVQWAQAALAGEQPGSSPGGEQPKFTATVQAEQNRYAALVKFAVVDAGKASQRWADLLVCEHLALCTLEQAGQPAAQSQLIDAQGHTCLEVRRFDRTAGVLGRRGFVSLRALDAAFVGSSTSDWGLSGDQLHAARWISSATAQRMARLHWFGRCIGNSDMHAGNLGFHLEDSGLLELVPTYDMLPMSLAPSSTGAVRAATPLQLGTPDRSGQIDHIRWASAAAMQFWEQVAADSRIGSTELRRLASTNREQLARYAKAFG